VDCENSLSLDLHNCHEGSGKVTLIHTRHKRFKCGIDEQTDMRSLADNLSDKDLVKISEQGKGHFHQYSDGEIFPIDELGSFHPFHPETALSPSIWQKALQVRCTGDANPVPPDEVLQLICARQEARKTGNWSLADDLTDIGAWLGNHGYGERSGQ
jgi:hypothetical protein